MRATPCRRAFTILELMIASGISLVVALALATLVVGVRRLMVRSFGVARTSLALRAERDRLQFHSLEEGGNALWAGLLSAGGFSGVMSDAVKYTSTGVDTWSRLSLGPRGGQVYERVLYKTSPYPVYRINDIETATLSAAPANRLFAVTLTHEYPDKELPAFPDGLRVRTSDRVVVPELAFGEEESLRSLSSKTVLECAWGGE